MSISPLKMFMFIQAEPGTKIHDLCLNCTRKYIATMPRGGVHLTGAGYCGRCDDEAYEASLYQNSEASLL